MTSGIVRRLYFIYWGSVDRPDWKNARTDELLYELTYTDSLRLPLRSELDYRIANTNRHSESYIANREMVEQFRPKKTRMCPLIYVELWEHGIEGTREELWTIDSDYWMKAYLQRLKAYLNTPELVPTLSLPKR